MDEIVSALADQQAELDRLLAPLAEDSWSTPTPRCPGWTIREVVLHLAQTNEMALGSLNGNYGEVVGRLTEGITLADGASAVDAGAAAMVAREVSLTVADVRSRWDTSANTLARSFERADLHTRVQWVVGTLSARTLATTRLAETWIHTGDVSDALDVEQPATERLRHIARLAWRTLPYAFEAAGKSLAGPVAFRLKGPDGDSWDYEPDEPPATVISGEAIELCCVAARRLDPSDTSLGAEGPDGATVLELVRTYA